MPIDFDKAWSDWDLRGAGPETSVDVLGNSVLDPASGFRTLETRGSVTNLDWRLPDSELFGSQPGRNPLHDHVQGLALVSSRKGYALALSRNRNGRSAIVAVASWKTGRLEHRVHMPVDFDHAGGLQGAGSIVAVACENNQSDAPGGLVLLDVDPTDGSMRPAGTLVIDEKHGMPVPKKLKPKVGWVAFTRLVDGTYLALLGGNRFGKDVGWLVTWDSRAAPEKAFTFVAGYGIPGETLVFDGGRSIAHGASFLVDRTDQSLYLVLVGTKHGSGGKERQIVYRVQKEATPRSVRFTPVTPKPFHVDGPDGTSVRYGSTVVPEENGAVTMLVSGRNPRLASDTLPIRWVRPKR